MALACLAGVIMLPWFVFVFREWATFRRTIDPAGPGARDLAIHADFNLLSWNFSTNPYERAKDLPAARIAAGSGSVAVLAWRTREIVIEAHSDSPTAVQLRQFYYPAWKATLLGTTRALPVEASEPGGVVLIHVPSGVQRVRFALDYGIDEIVGIWISLAALAAWCWLCWRARAFRRDLAAGVEIH